jgi:hypothetical protein
MIADLPNFDKGTFTDISGLVVSASVAYNMEMASELSFDIVDVGMAMSKKNYFTLARDVVYETQTIGQINSQTGEVKLVRQLFEMANITVAQGGGGSVIYSIKCYTKAIQQMKRDKKPSAVKGNGTTFIRNAAQKYGLKVHAEQTSKAKTITKATGSTQAESLWDVMKRLASDAQFVLFEVDGFLVFGTEKWLMNNWGTDVIYPKQIPKTKKNPNPKKKETLRFVPLQFPNDSANYVGTPGRFLLSEHPTITKSDNDAYAADGSCTVMRTNGTQLRPGMTAYVGTVNNMSGYYLITDVTFNEMVSDSVSVSFRTRARDERKGHFEKIKTLPVGEKYAQTYIPGVNPGKGKKQIQTVKSESKDASGKPINKPSLDPRILPIPDAANPYGYPTMHYANLTKTYPLYKNQITGGAKGAESTNDIDCLIFAGNMDLYNRPALPFNYNHTKGVHTIFSQSHPFLYGSEWRAIIFPVIWTDPETNLAFILEDMAQVATVYEEFSEADMGAPIAEGGVPNLGLVRGATKDAALKNARDYAYLLSWQQELIVNKRFPGYVNTKWLIPNTPGGADSIWTGSL